MKNFGVESNGLVCSCGGHHGVGTYPNGDKNTPGDRAAGYKHYLPKIGDVYTDSERQRMEDYLASYETIHGPVAYEIREVGKCPKISTSVYLDGSMTHAPRITNEETSTMPPGPAMSRHWAEIE